MGCSERCATIHLLGWLTCPAPACQEPCVRPVQPGQELCTPWLLVAHLHCCFTGPGQPILSQKQSFHPLFLPPPHWRVASNYEDRAEPQVITTPSLLQLQAHAGLQSHAGEATEHSDENVTVRPAWAGTAPHSPHTNLPVSPGLSAFIKSLAPSPCHLSLTAACQRGNDTGNHVRVGRGGLPIP